MSERTVRVAVFGPQAEAAGTTSLEVSVSTGEPTASAILAAIAASYPSLAGSLAASRLACDHAFAPPDAAVDLDGELALIGLVGGG